MCLVCNHIKDKFQLKAETKQLAPKGIFLMTLQILKSGIVLWTLNIIKKRTLPSTIHLQLPFPQNLKQVLYYGALNSYTRVILGNHWSKFFFAVENCQVFFSYFTICPSILTYSVGHLGSVENLSGRHHSPIQMGVSLKIPTAAVFKQNMTHTVDKSPLL